MTPEATTADSAGDADETAVRATRSTWAIVSGVSLMSTGLAAYEIVPASVTPLIRDSLGIGPTLAGLLVGVMFGTAVVASLPIGAVLDRTDSRNALALSVAAAVVAGVGGWVAGVRGAFAWILAARVLAGIAYVVVWNAGIDIVSREVRPEIRATAVGIFTASGPVGFALGQGTGPLIADRFGWPAIFLAFTGLAAVGLLVFWPASRGVTAGDGSAPSARAFGAVLRNRNVWTVGTVGFLGYAIYLFVNSWGSTYLTEEVGLSLALSGLLVAVFPAVGVVARISGGVLSDRAFGGRRRPVALGSFVVAAPLLLFFTRFRSVSLLLALLCLTGFAVQLSIGLSFTYIREVVDPQVAATAVAFQTSVGLAGAFLSPIAGGVVVERAGFETAFLLAGGLAVAGIAVAWQAPEPGAS